MDPVTVIAALGALAAWLSLMQNEQYRLRDQEKAAVKALHRAVKETRLYAKRVQPPKGKGDEKPSTEKEYKLSKLWHEAFLALMDIDDALARKCEVKSGYWEEPEEWSQNQISVADISLEKISKEAEPLQKAFM